VYSQQIWGCICRHTPGVDGIPAAGIGPLADVARIRWFSLHDRDSTAQLGDAPRLPLVDLNPWITDVADTAAAIANLDLSSRARSAPCVPRSGPSGRGARAAGARRLQQSSRRSSE
jgi:hypothetical protein